MYPRWQTDGLVSPPALSQRETGPRSSRLDRALPPMPTLESQLAAELEGASWTVLAFAPEDALWADWLYRNLNGYPVPPPMTESATSHGLPRPDCVSVFPDRRDPEYGAHFPQALEKSGYLVVVCSPHSARCAEVDAQICAFKNAGGEERIIALVVEGGPDGALENAAKTGVPEWLPAWLRWRFAGDSFAEADGGEPRIVDARPGRAGGKEVRDVLLATLLDVDAWELEVAGCLDRPVEAIRSAPRAITPVPANVVAPARAAPVGSSLRHMILTAAICVTTTLVVAWWSFDRVKTYQAQPLAAPAHVTAVGGKLPTADAVVPATELATSAVEATEPVMPTAAISAVPQRPSSASTPLTAIAAVRSFLPPPSAAERSVEEPPAPPPMATLHQLGDAAVNERRLDAALGFYEEAVEARATDPRATPEARAEAAVLCRKLGTLQLQMASTAEARRSFVQGRKLLLQLKAHGHWNAQRAKILAGLEVSLRQLPRD